ncbi:uncharacterized protein M6B38_396435 [Iris pallida]|uniref:F-box domain-containing protein n=1 Tax=Iris pallida TaxID=29817 RepID=A0AAX6FWC5_IRIPA|nr:uncharacterized protein M6B38_236765 [Iris pallida]KAJ6820670.1 uncharacterized protein M6B38_396435 [Iris pallida]
MEPGIILGQPPPKMHTNGNNHVKDRISELPDCVLHHILSFLETKLTVQTSILSKRWAHLWASVPALDFTDESFIRNEEGWLDESDTHSFENFVDTVLLLRDASDLRSFDLRCYHYSDGGHLLRWIRYAAKYNPKVLQIEFSPHGGNWCLPLGILPCQSLEELTMNLRYRVNLGPPCKIMGRLRRLHIQRADDDVDGFMENLISSCPVLEDLDVRSCQLDALCISSSTLKRLSIKDCCIFGGDENRISIPSLVCLTYTNNISGCTALENLSSLLNATVDTTGGDLIELCRGLANAETLKISFPEDYQVKLPEDLSQFPVFGNLRSLALGGLFTSDMIQVVALFLQHSSNLKTFTLTLNNRKVPSPLSMQRLKVIQKSGNFSFICPHIQLIEIQCYQMEEKLHELIKYFLMNAIGVPKLVINRTGPIVAV